ncbi:MAG: DMT family transporter [Clostridia bacterium]|nr:DMT family transporter [Clostridia bacterium]
MQKKNNYILMSFAAVFWAGAFIAGKLGINELSPIMLTYLRFLFASIILFGVMKRHMGTDWRLSKSDYKMVLQLSVVGMIGYHLPFFLALRYTTASKAAMINASNPLITAALAALFLGDRLTMKRIGYILIAFMGVLLTITDWQIFDILHLGVNKGDLIMLFASCCWSSYSVLVKSATAKMHPLKLSTYTFIGCVLLLTPFALKEMILDHALNVSAGAYAAVIYMAVFPTVLGYTIQQLSIKEIGPAKTALFINLVPVFSTVLAIAFLKEAVNPINILSGLMIIGAVIGNSRLR